jgi:hypothetical protein|tara:strand:+ start:548 stop:829 length:282 start_codon:yes stop_codon:yes gene_type:complete
VSTEKRFINNVVKFPGCQNQQLDEQQREILKHTSSIAAKMSDPNWFNLPISHIELSILSNHGETIEFAPITTARLNSVLATTLIRNSFMEDLL